MYCCNHNACVHFQRLIANYDINISQRETEVSHPQACPHFFCNRLHHKVYLRDYYCSLNEIKACIFRVICTNTIYKNYADGSYIMRRSKRGRGLGFRKPPTAWIITTSLACFVYLVYVYLGIYVWTTYPICKL